MPEYGFNAAEGKMKIFFEDQNVRIDTVSCNINEGKLFAFGTLEHEGLHLKKAIMDAQIAGVKYRYSDVGSFLLKNASLRYEKIDDAADFSGIIRFDEARVPVNFRPQSLLPFARNVSRPKSRLSETLGSIRLNLQVKESDKLWIDNNLARLRLAADVTVLGNPENFKIAGKVNCKEGYLLYLDRKFQVKQGVVDFIDPDRLNPEITLQAVASLKAYQTLEKQEYDITLSINGPLEHAVVDLASEPVLESAGSALLTVGATRKSLTDINSTGRKISANEILRRE